MLSMYLLHTCFISIHTHKQSSVTIGHWISTVQYHHEIEMTNTTRWFVTLIVFGCIVETGWCIKFSPGTMLTCSSFKYETSPRARWLKIAQQQLIFCVSFIPVTDSNRLCIHFSLLLPNRLVSLGQFFHASLKHQNLTTLFCVNIV